ncbi:hypothetical protein [Melghirimyces algeriensis]|uniref:Uncharacterized protein n=1 Tax=Melghirimyces algeriensis TaxID=910412 RepID=A0A521EP05_9BACL|nr:hypothetical protein [Melghirimyces algeriensis]SMO85659.1 hypothetical protein SAMN06264849_11036 [Melghirimyces algeriensis]
MTDRVRVVVDLPMVYRQFKAGVYKTFVLLDRYKLTILMVSS